jgi:hypothetical protein
VCEPEASPAQWATAVCGPVFVGVSLCSSPSVWALERECVCVCVCMGGWRALGEYPKGGTGEAACSYDVLLIDSETQVVWKVQRGLMGDFAPQVV